MWTTTRVKRTASREIREIDTMHHHTTDACLRLALAPPSAKRKQVLICIGVAVLLLAGSPARADAQTYPERIKIDTKSAGNVFAADAPERKLRQAGLQKKREDANRRDREAWAGM